MGKHVAEFLCHSLQRDLQRVGILLTEGVKMQTVEQVNQLRRHISVPLGTSGPEAGAGRAGIVDLVALLGGALGIDAQAPALAGGLRPGAELRELSRGVEDDVARVVQQLVELVRPVGPAEDVDLLLRQLLPAQPRLEQTAGLGPGQERDQGRVAVVVGKGLLGQEHPAAGPLGDLGQDLPVSSQLPLVENVAGCGKAPEDLFGGPAVQRGEGSSRLRHGTSTGSVQIERGRPC